MRAGARRFAEPLEPRMLLSGSLLVVPSATVAVTGFNLSSPIADGSAGTAYATVSQNADNGTAGYYQQITGDVILQWYGGGQLADLPLTQQTGGITSTAFSGQIPCGLSEGAAGPAIPSGPLKGYHILEYYYTGNANFAPTAQFTSADFQNAAAGKGAVGNVILVQFAPHLAFIQNPSDTAAGDTIKPPVTVALEDGSGNITATASDTVTLTIASGSGTLSGTVSEPAVHGIATFSNLSINNTGSYTLSASDTTHASTRPATSSLFHITNGKLVFLSPTPASGTAGDPLQPDIKVALEDGKGKIITSNSTTVVTLAPIGLTSGNPIAGNSATLVNGVATFSNVVLTKPGTYQLLASDGGDATAATKPFKVSGDTLVFKPGPTNTYVDQPLTFTVEAINPLGKVDTTLTDSVQVSLNVISGGTNATLAGTLSGSLAGGVLHFSTASGVSINAAGTYTLTVNDAASSSVSPQTSTQFTITGLHLDFYNVPKTFDYGQNISSSIVLLDSANHPVTSSPAAGASVTISLLNAAVNSVSDYTVTLKSGHANLLLAPPTSAVAPPGTYSLGAATADPAIQAGLSPDFQIKGLHLDFYNVPKTFDYGQNISSSIVLLDSANRRVTTGPEAGASVTISLFNAADNSVSDYTATLKSGRANLLLAPPPSAVAPPGTYSLGAATADSAIQVGLSPDFQIKGLHLDFYNVPKTFDYGQNISSSIVLLDSANRRVTTGPEAGASVTISLFNAADNSVSDYTVTLKSGRANLLLAPPPSTVAPPGTYSLGAATADSAIQVGLSPDFQIRGLHLDFYNVPKAFNNGQNISSSIVLLDSANQPVTTGPEAGVTVTISLDSAGGTSVSDYTVTLKSGGANLLLAPPPSTVAPAGTYSLGAVTADTAIEVGLSPDFNIK